MLLLCACLVTVLGLGSFAMSLPRHWRQLCHTAQPSRRAMVMLRGSGTLALLLSLLLCMASAHPTMAVLVWVMQLALAAVLVALLFTWCAPATASKS